jgi:C4-dicarboxylate-specific signal transduction histidine kinase
MAHGYNLQETFLVHGERRLLKKQAEVTMVANIGERKRAKQALRTSEREQLEIAKQLQIERARLIEAQAVAKVGSWELDLPSLAITWTEQTHRIFETDPSHFHPRRPDFVEFVHPEDRAKVDAAFEASLERRAASTVEYRIVLADGRVKVVEEHWKVFEEQGRLVRLMGTCQDITERKRADEVLRKSQAELARITRAVTMGELTSSIAHEINQPLTAIVADVSASLRWLTQKPPNLQEAREALVEAIREANHASDVIGRIRALLRNTPPSMRRLDIGEVTVEVLAMARGELEGHGIGVKTEIAADTPLVLGDHIQLQQLLLNLIMNGIDAMTMIKDRPRELLIRAAPHRDGVLVQVEDSGKGVDPDQADRIFEPFFTSKPQGIGMGLAISRSIVEAHGGRLWVTSDSPYGTIFQFTLQKAENPHE